MKLKQYIITMIAIAVFFFGMPIMASVSFYTDRSAWESAVSGDVVTENFNSLSPFVMTEGINAAGLIDMELLNISRAEFNYMDDGFAWSDWTPFFHGNLHRDDPDATIDLILPNAATAFGGDFDSTDSSDGLWLQVNGVSYKFGDWLLSDGGTGFLGFVSTDAFSTVTLFDPVQGGFRLGETFGLDNVGFVTIPEPVTIALLCLGSSLLRKRKKI